jgi:hypothetical protein
LKGSQEELRKNGRRGKIKKAIGLMLAIIAVAMIVSTSAVSQMTANRDMTVVVAADSVAYVALSPCDDTNNHGFFVDILPDGRIAVNFDATTQGGQGINTGAVTWINKVFEITNLCEHTIQVNVNVQWLTWSTYTPSLLFANGDHVNTIEGNYAPAISYLDPGESICVDFKFDTSYWAGVLPLGTYPCTLTVSAEEA